jgi:hypothetical protein
MLALRFNSRLLEPVGLFEVIFLHGLVTFQYANRKTDEMRFWILKKQFDIVQKEDAAIIACVYKECKWRNLPLR